VTEKEYSHDPQIRPLTCEHTALQRYVDGCWLCPSCQLAYRYHRRYGVTAPPKPQPEPEGDTDDLPHVR